MLVMRWPTLLTRIRIEYICIPLIDDILDAISNTAGNMKPDLDSLYL